MSKTPIQNPTLIRQSDYEIPSSTRIFPLGLQIQLNDITSDTMKPYASVYEYLRANDDLKQYGIYTINGNATGIVAGLLTNGGTSAGYARVIVPQTNVTNSYYFFGCVKGMCTAAATAAAGQDMTVATVYKILNAATTLSPSTAVNSSATAPATVRDVSSVAFSTGLSATSANNQSVYLFGDPILHSSSIFL
jgi:hypothetical protein